MDTKLELIDVMVDVDKQLIDPFGKELNVESGGINIMYKLTTVSHVEDGIMMLIRYV